MTFSLLAFRLIKTKKLVLATLSPQTPTACCSWSISPTFYEQSFRLLPLTWKCKHKWQLSRSCVQHCCMKKLHVREIDSTLMTYLSPAGTIAVIETVVSSLLFHLNSCHTFLPKIKPQAILHFVTYTQTSTHPILNDTFCDYKYHIFLAIIDKKLCFETFKT